ncbi:uncharacterized protein PITG_09063 [Phytophthora infestans T30-4]|uniref:Uncharacterized protein n=1 Tax=Phytophthora infestans (strain T30-4) TaxID=403677 RepID=D0NBL7_PHYIT|nr:uncharacterized protein PITG_09063 [Phytophthora infestans T30-4]EEY55172.1 conserved hypothetical protein [Phytophthora infestans T30-4]|eukprot:XP_002903396.1 conserved hypothetical protein [Phytophthora infestans T30-4]
MHFEAVSPVLSSSATHKQPAVMSAKKSNLSWKRRKDELHRLRAESQALETRVMFLKMRKTQATLLKAGVGLFDEQKQLRDAAVYQCQSAREENRQLKDKLKRCYKACHDLQTVLSVAGIKQHNLLMANPFAAKALQAEQRSQGLLELNSDVLLSLENRVNERLTELSYIIGKIRASMSGPDVDQVNVHREGVEGASASVEFKRNRLMPFNADYTSRVVWDVMHLGAIPDEHCTRVTKRSHDTLLSQGCETQALAGGGTVDLVAKAWTHATRDSGWALVHPNEERPGTCQVQLAVRLRTESHEQQNGPTLLTPVVSDVVIPSFGEVLSARHQLVENALLDSTRAATEAVPLLQH